MRNIVLCFVLSLVGTTISIASAFVRVLPNTNILAYGRIREKHQSTNTFSLYASSSIPNKEKKTLVSDSNEINNILICGGGPAGLLSAIMLAQKFPQSHIQVYDRQSMPASPNDETVWNDTGRHYLIGLGGRGITALELFDVDISSYALKTPGRVDWTPEQPNGVQSIRTERKYVTQVLPRNKLVSILYQQILQDRYASQIDVTFNSQVRPVDFDYNGDDDDDNNGGGDGQVLVEVSSLHDDVTSWEPKVVDVLVVTEGSTRTFAKAMETTTTLVDSNKEDPFRVVSFEDDNVRVYKTLPFKIPDKKWQIDPSNDQDDIFWNYAVRSSESRVIFDALPANDKGDYVGVLLMKGDDDMAKPNIDPIIFSNFLKQEIPQFYDLIDTQVIEDAAKKDSSNLPTFQYVTPRMHQGKRTVLLGDTAHTVKPFFGMGANSALEDVKILADCIDQSVNRRRKEHTYNDQIYSVMTEAIYCFSERRTNDMATLVQTSRDLDRPGILGVFYFLIPVILDGIFSKLAPQVFQPNIISLIQNEEYTFQEAVQRKKQDRILQLSILSLFFGLVGTIVVGLIQAIFF